MIKSLIKQIDNLISILIQTGFSVSHNFTSEKNGNITWSDFKDISFVLKNQPYEEIYYECIKERAFNIMLIDGALLQLMYKCDDTNVVAHRLAFLPNPNIERFQDNPEEYEDLYLNSQLFADVIEKKVVSFPLRFDFDCDPQKYISCDHSYCHMTLGNYKNCRIPCAKPLSPIKFIHFILKSFYYDKYVERLTHKDFECDLVFDSLLDADEQKIIHVSH